VTAIELDSLTWPQVRAQIESGRDTVVVALGATEQHGHHLPLATDALIGDHLARLVAERLDAFRAPTVRIGCSEHHVGFAGTMSITEETFHAIVSDLVRSLASGGFRRIVLLPTHGGNFAPLAGVVAKLGDVQGTRVLALTDLGVLFQVAQMGEREYGVPLSEGGLHAGEWETSMLLAIRPDLAQMEHAQAGFTGDLQDALQTMFASGGVASISENGTIGDPTRASVEHGERYWDAAVELVLEQIKLAESQDAPRA
jgi:creatinine amidohydrolase